MPMTYDPEFKARAVRLVRDHLADYGSVTAASFAVGAQLGVSRETLRRWVAQAEVDDGARPGLTTAEADELRRLRAENKRLREANEILKAASIFGSTAISVGPIQRLREIWDLDCHRPLAST